MCDVEKLKDTYLECKVPESRYVHPDRPLQAPREQDVKETAGFTYQHLLNLAHEQCAHIVNTLQCVRSFATHQIYFIDQDETS